MGHFSICAVLKVRYQGSLLARLVENDEDISRLQSLEMHTNYNQINFDF